MISNDFRRQKQNKFLFLISLILQDPIFVQEIDDRKPEYERERLLKTLFYQRLISFLVNYVQN